MAHTKIAVFVLSYDLALFESAQ